MSKGIIIDGVRRPTRGVYRWIDVGVGAVIRVTVLAVVLVLVGAGLLALLVLLAVFF